MHTHTNQKTESIHKYISVLSQSDLISFCPAKNADQPANVIWSLVTNLEGTEAQITSTRWVNPAQRKISIPPDPPGLKIRTVTTGRQQLHSKHGLNLLSLTASEPGNVNQKLSNDRHAYYDGRTFASEKGEKR